MADLTAGQVPRYDNVRVIGRAAIVNATGIVAMGVVTNGILLQTADATYGGRCYSLTGCTDDAAIAPLVHIFTVDGSNNVTPLGTVTMPVSSGNTLAARANVNFFDGSAISGLLRDAQGNYYYPLGPGEKLYAGVLVSAPTSGKTVWIKASGANGQA